MEGKLVKKVKQILALVLAVALVFCTFPDQTLSVWAVESAAIESAETSIKSTSAQKTEITSADFSVSNLIYTGQSLTPTVVIAEGSSITGEITDNFDITYKKDDGTGTYSESEVKDAGSYQVCITAKSASEAYSGTAELDFTVEQLDLNTCTVNLADESSYIYTGQEINPEISVTCQGSEVSSELYEITYDNNINVAYDEGQVIAGGSVKISAASGNDNVTGENSQAFTIQPLSLSAEDVQITVSPSGSTWFGGDEIELSISVTSDSGTNTIPPDDYKVAFYLNNESVDAACAEGNYFVRDEGTYSVKITPAEDSGNLLSEAEVTFVVSYDETITTDCVSVSGETYTSEDGVKYYTSSDSITIAPLDGYKILSVESGGTLSAGVIHLNQDAEEVVFYLQNTGTGTANKLTVGKFQRDDDPPVITVKDGELEIASESVVYLNQDDLTEGIKTFTVTISDQNGSGINPDTVTSQETFTPTDADGVEHTELTNKAADYLENEAAHTFTVCYDAVAPIFQISYNNAVRLVSDADSSAENDLTDVAPQNGYTAYYDGDITVQLELEEDNALVQKDGDTITAMEDLTLELTKDGVQLDGTALPAITWEYDETTGKYTGSFTLTEDGSYQIAISYQDAAGNLMVQGTEQIDGSSSAVADGSYISTVMVIDTAEPTVTVSYTDQDGNEISPVVSCEGSDGYVRDYFQDAYLQIVVQDAHIRVNSLVDELKNLTVFTSDRAEKDKEATNAWSYIVNQMDTAVICEDGSQTFRIPLTTEGNYNISVSYTNLLGKQTTAEALYTCVDSTAPSNEVYVEYETDISESDGSKNLLNQAWGYIRRVFGKEKVTVALYVHDTDAGIKTLTYQYNGKETTVEIDRKEEYFVTWDGVNEDYTEILISLPVEDANSAETIMQMMDTLKVTEITDWSGNNVSDSVSSHIIEGTTKIVIDNVRPSADISYPVENASDGDGKDTLLFYIPEENETAEVIAFTFTERYFLENLSDEADEASVIYPLITITADGEELSGETAEQYISWSEFDDESDTITASVSLPYSTETDGAEIEYKLYISYTDGSCNELTLSDDTYGLYAGNETGLYETEVLVLDNKAPSLTKFEITGTTDRQSPAEAGETDVYHNVDGDDISFEFELDENEKYWEKENFTFILCNLTTGIRTDITEDAAFSLTCSSGSGVYQGSYSFDGEESPAEYQVEMSYVDKAGNLLVKAAEVTVGSLDETSGIYKSPAFILDDVKPVFQISYNKAVRLVFDFNGENDADEEQSTEDIENAAPQSGYIAYYDGDITVQFEIAEDYAQLQMDDGVITAIDDFVLEITKDGTKLDEDELPEISWETDEANDGCYYGEFTLTEDGTYQIAISYQDAAANQMEQDAEKLIDGSGNAVVEGAYTSTVMVIDTDVPVINVSYTDQDGNEVSPVDSCTDADGNTRDYFTDVYLQIEVIDANIRCDELVQELLEFELFTADREEKDREESAAYAYINEQMDGTKIYSQLTAPEVYADGGMVWRIPLTTEGNYNFTAVYTDLAGHAAEEKEVFVCVDRATPAEDIYVQYTSDVSEAEQSKSFLDKAWDYVKRIFGKEKITVTLYVHDLDAGIKSLTYQYNGKEDTFEVDKTNESFYQLPEDTDGSMSYEAIEITLPVTGSGDADTVREFIDTLKIVEVTDWSGNSNSNVEQGYIKEGTMLLVVDNVAPKVSVEYPTAHSSQQSGDTTYHYYSQTSGQTYEVVELTYTERFYEENLSDEADSESVIYPVILINGEAPASVGVTAQGDSVEAMNMPCVSWSVYDEETHEIKAEVYLPYNTQESGAEIEYVITTSYEDGSQNALALSDKNQKLTQSQEEGTFETEVFVLDNEAPQLTKFEITGTTDRQSPEAGETAVYHNVDGADITFTFAIDDNPDYWTEDNFTFKVYDLDLNKVMTVTNIQMSQVGSTRVFQGSFSFDGEGVEEPATFHATLSYADRAGNLLEKTANVVIGSFDDATGTYTSPDFILDHESPTLNISYNKAYRLVLDKETLAANDKLDSVPKTGYTAYYNNNIKVTFEITEEYAMQQKEDSKLTSLQDFTLSITKDGNKLSDAALPEISWTYDESQYKYTGTFSLSEEGTYQITVSYQDAAVNRLVSGDTVQGANTESKVSDGTYTSTTLVIDKTAPVITASYTDLSHDALKASNEYKGRSYFKEQAALKVVVDDDNIRYEELKNEMSGIAISAVNEDELSDVAENPAKVFIESISDAKISHAGVTWYIPLTAEASYDIPIAGSAYEDLAGNSASYDTQYCCIDTTKPTDLSFSYSVTETAYMDIINYKDFGFAFADKKLTVTVTANDATAGIHYVVFNVTDENGNTETITETFKPSDSVKTSIVLPLETDDFKGSVRIKVVDYSVNAKNKTEEQVIESTETHSNTGSAAITTAAAPGRIVDGISYYNTDVGLNITFTDNYSGIKSYEYTAGSQIYESHNFAAEAGGDLSEEPVYEITNTVSKDIVLTAADNNSNEVAVSASFVDNAGHTGTAAAEYNIDVTVPVIEVTYDNNDPANETYYKDTRVATVVITERNFSSADVVFSITNTDGVMPSVSDWETSGSGDETKHTAKVTFSEDGDYTFTVAFQDLAGNKAVYDRIDEFTIDQTLPEYTISYDNESAQNEYYYDAQRTATIDVTEHNFDASLIEISVTQDGAAVAASVSGWTSREDHNIATVTFAADAEYTFTISGMDMAENEMEAYTEDHFVVDTEAPTIEIFDIEDMSANNGVVQPGIRYSDTNYDADATVVNMVGYRNGTVEMNGSTTTTGTGVEVKLNDFEHTQDMDDIYTMQATVYDMAGNSAEAEVIFSVNRFGSVYTFNEETDELVGDNGKYYTNEEQDIVIVETNVDTLEFKEITCNYNGELTTMQEGEDYTVEVSGSDVSWKQYTYHLAQENFTQEGTYTLTVYSEDKAMNTSDNSSKGKKVEFVVDKTSPSILIAGIENEGQYSEDSHEVTIDVDDNVSLSSVSVDIDGDVTTYHADELADLDGRIILSVASKNNWQTLSVTALDAAGNEYTSDEIRYLITANLFIQLYANKPVFFGIVGGVIVVAAGIYWFIFLRRKKEKNQEA